MIPRSFTLADREEGAAEATLRRLLVPNAPPFRPRSSRLSSHSAPGTQINAAHRDAENIGGNKSQLCGANTNNADDDAVDRGEGPAFPAAASHQYRGRNGQHTRQIIKPEHKQNPSTNHSEGRLAVFVVIWIAGRVTEVTPCASHLIIGDS